MTREQRLVFGEVAELYDRARPPYPDELFDRVVAFAAISPPARVLEVGAGTGKATVPFASRGYAVHALEPSEEMAAVLRAHTAQYPATVIEAASFEEWEVERRAFPLVYSATAWHWVTPGVRLERAHAALAADGALAVFALRPDWPSTPVHQRVDAVYERVVPGFTSRLPGSPKQESKYRSGIEELRSSALFDAAEPVSIPFHVDLPTAAYLELLRTQSDHRLIDAETLDRLLEEIGRVVDDDGGSLAVDYRAELTLARRVA